jgi:catechol 2,3-dioxygenase-like lactoylglutathione lyase family enzyme
MSQDELTTLFLRFDRGVISRRQLLQALGMAMVASPVSSALSQGRCGGTRAGTAACDTTPWKYPFDPTGWKTVLLDRFTMQAADYEQEAAYYASLMNWTVRSDDGTRAVLDIGDVGTVIIRGGYQAPAPTAPPRATNDSGAARGGGGGRGNRAPRRVVWDSFCWGIEPWDAKKVEAELRKRGLDPIADNEGKDFQSFHVRDPDGFDLQISNGNRRNRRRERNTAKLSAPAPFDSTNWKTVWLDHISFGVSNYKESVAFYSALLGWKPTGDEGSQNECQIGDIGNIIIRGGNPAAGGGRGGGAGGSSLDSTGGRGGQAAAPARRAQMDHIAFGITPFDPDAVKAELDKRGLSSRPDTGGKGDIHDAAARYKSYHTTTPNGFDLQISNTTEATRNVR